MCTTLSSRIKEFMRCWFTNKLEVKTKGDHSFEVRWDVYELENILELTHLKQKLRLMYLLGSSFFFIH